MPPPLRATLRARPEGAPAYAYRVPDPLGEPVAVGPAAEAGLPPAVLEALVRTIETDPAYDQVHAVLVARHGRLVFEEYFFGHDAARPHDLRSATKSVVAALAGVAVREGLLTLDTPVLRLLAERMGVAISAHKAALTLADLLDMRHGLACDDWDDASPGNERRVYEADDWIAALLAVPDAAPGGPTASYCSAVALAVGRAIELASGRPLPDYAQERLFGPLGIRRADWSWDFALENRGASGSPRCSCARATSSGSARSTSTTAWRTGGGCSRRGGSGGRSPRRRRWGTGGGTAGSGGRTSSPLGPAGRSGRTRSTWRRGTGGSGCTCSRSSTSSSC